MIVKNITVLAKGDDTPGFDFELFLKGQRVSYYRIPRSDLEAGKEYQAVYTSDSPLPVIADALRVTVAFAGLSHEAVLDGIRIQLPSGNASQTFGLPMPTAVDGFIAAIPALLTVGLVGTMASLVSAQLFKGSK